MKLLLMFAILLFISSNSCINKKEDNLEFGRKYNPARQRFEVPLIQDNMAANKCCVEYPIYEIAKIPQGNSAYHYSKSVNGILNHKITSEKDIYRKSIDDTTLIQLNVYTKYDWTLNKASMSGDLDTIDKRELERSATNLLKDGEKYTQYQWRKMTLIQSDSILKSWNLSRLDK